MIPFWKNPRTDLSPLGSETAARTRILRNSPPPTKNPELTPPRRLPSARISPIRAGDVLSPRQPEQIHDTMNRLLTLLFALGLLAVPTFGQTADGPSGSAPAEYTFRFVADDDMFYIPWNGNGEELDRLIACIAENRAAILDGAVPVEVEGRCTSQPSAAENLAVAKTRSNRVKTEMILRGGLTEACFTTKNLASGGNLVTVRIVIPAGPSEAEREAQRRAAEEAERLAAEKRAEAERLAAEREREERLAAARAEAEREAREPVVRVEEPAEPEACAMGLDLRTNLLRWATLTPDLGVEWHISDRWSLGVGGSWTSWSWSDKDRRYALWEVAPEVRYYMGAQRRGYLGAMFKAGAFNYKLSETGRQGDILGGGLTGGYILPLGKRLALDFSLGLGCLHADCEKYRVIDGVRVRQGSETRNWWGPVHAGISLKWNLF